MGDITIQTRRVFDRIKIAMEDAGGRLDNLVHLVIYTTGRDQRSPELERLGESFLRGIGPQVSPSSSNP